MKNTDPFITFDGTKQLNSEETFLKIFIQDNITNNKFSMHLYIWTTIGVKKK